MAIAREIQETIRKMRLAEKRAQEHVQWAFLCALEDRQKNWTEQDSLKYLEVWNHITVVNT